MMNRQHPPTGLFELLARSWDRPAAVATAVFSGDGATVAFAGADGTVSLARVADPESALSRVRVSGDLGQTSIRPPARAPRPLVDAPAFGAGPPPLAATTGADFLVGGADGAVVRLLASGEVEPTTVRLDGPVTALAASAGGAAAATDGGAVTIFAARGEGAPVRLAVDDAGGIGALAFARGGRRLAVATADGLVVLDTVGDGAVLAAIALPGRALAPVWAPGDRLVGTPLDGGGFALIDPVGGAVRVFGDFPTAVRDVSFSGPAEAVLASGAFRVAGWSTVRPAPVGDPGGGAILSGRAGLVPVERLAAHPTRSLVAAGYANGQILLVQVGARGELLVKPAGGAVTALAWSPDGRHLAAGSADGSASIVTFPPQLFK